VFDSSPSSIAAYVLIGSIRFYEWVMTSSPVVVLPVLVLAGSLAGFTFRSIKSFVSGLFRVVAPAARRTPLRKVTREEVVAAVIGEGERLAGYRNGKEPNHQRVLQASSRPSNAEKPAGSVILHNPVRAQHGYLNGREGMSEFRGNSFRDRKRL
jgi:hypothetical protein